MSIRKLSPETANQIAAGEVVESPSSVVKELIENALDAGAGRISVTLKNGGLQEITVTDDGGGIASDELRIALQRHATSKIQRIEDLENIHTLGFRGEALPSIASVAKVTLTSRREQDEAGVSIYLEGGSEKSFGEVGFPVGTRVTVQDLFYNTPARKKFLKGVPAETAKISRMIQVLALSRPEVAFKLSREKGGLLETFGEGKLLNVILRLYGYELGRQLLPVDYTEGDYSLYGYVSNPYYFRNSKTQQFFFVNGRAVQSKPLRESLAKSSGELVTSKKFPLAFLFLTLPGGELDVNVHPSKTEIRLYREDFTRVFLNKSLSSAFQGGVKIPVYDWAGEAIKKTGAGYKNIYGAGGKQQPAGEGFVNETVIGAGSQEAVAGYEKKEAQPGGNLTLFPAEREEGPYFDYDVIIGQAFETYVFLQKGAELYIMDQHAAHERVLWESVLKQYKERIPGSQITLPLPFELPPDLAEELSGKLDIFEEIGLELAHFGGNTFVARKIPDFIKDRFHPEMLCEILEKQIVHPLEREDFQKEALMQLSCKAAVKAHKVLRNEEIERLLKDLRKCDNPYTCPHGRPIFIKMGRNDLEKYFKR